MMINRRLFPLLIIGALFSTQLTAQEADCGRNCASCGDNKWEGYSYASDGDWDMFCVGPTEDGYCAQCGLRSASYSAVSAVTIATAIRSAQEADLNIVVAAYGERLSVHERRNLVVVHGSGCDPKGPAAVVYLNPAKLRALRKFGIPSYSSNVKGIQLTRVKHSYSDGSSIRSH